jgi:hypothetical protein
MGDETASYTKVAMPTYNRLRVTSFSEQVTVLLGTAQTFKILKMTFDLLKPIKLYNHENRNL